MTEQPDSFEGTDDAIPSPVVHKRRLSSALIWLVPVVAALIGLVLVVQNWLQAGPTISITFQTADGVDPGKTPVKFKNVAIGKVTSVQLSDDRSHVVVKVDLDKSAKSFATKDTRYWVVRPRIGLGGVSGVDTLLSGAFIGADVGDSKEEQLSFQGMESPPAVNHGEPGKTFMLHADDLGSLDIGSPVYYRRIQVGQITSYKLDPDGKGVSLQLFVKGPNDKFVTTSTRFWNASGVDVSLSAAGLKLNTESLATVLAGGVAFQGPPGPHDSTPAPANTQFSLYSDQSTAMAPPDGQPRYIRMHFNQSLRGLEVNAPVEFLGINIGHVVSVNLDYDEKAKRFPIIVGALIYPDRLGKARDKLAAIASQRGEGPDLSHTLKLLVDHGLRAQARNGNLLTGQLYIALDFLPKAAKVSFDPDRKPMEIPTAPGSFDKLQEQISTIMDKVAKIPFDSIGNNLNQSLANLNQTLQKVNGEVLPQVKGTLKNANRTLGHADDLLSNDSPLQQNLGGTLEQLQRMARSLRVLSDYLSAHPEALIRGRQADAKPQSADPTPSTTGSKKP